MSHIRAGRVEEAIHSSGEWAFIDPGFSRNAKSCGFLVEDGHPVPLTFADLQARLIALASVDGHPLNLVLEAPLSVAFGPLGNPVGRSIELRGSQSRYWYVGLGCGVLVAATYLLRALTDAQPRREIRLFEGLVSFKPKCVRSSHLKDVLLLRRIVWGEQGFGQIVAPEALASAPDHLLVSAFRVAGMNYGVPPVIAAGG